MLVVSDCAVFRVDRRWRETDLALRARSRGDLDRLRERYLPFAPQVLDDFMGTFSTAVKIAPAVLADALKQMVLDITYGDLERAVAKQQGPDGADVVRRIETAARSSRAELELLSLAERVHQGAPIRPGFERLIMSLVTPSFAHPRSYCLFRRVRPRVRIAEEDQDAPAFQVGVFTIAERKATNATDTPQPTFREAIGPVAASDVRNLLDLVDSIRMPATDTEDSLRLVLDGVGYEVRLGESLGGLSFAWSTSPPAGWEPLQEIAERLEAMAPSIEHGPSA